MQWRIKLDGISAKGHIPRHAAVTDNTVEKQWA